MTEYIMVLDDGETFSGLEQCHVIEIDTDAMDPGDDGDLERRLDALMRTDETELGPLRIVQAFAGPEGVMDDELREALVTVKEAAHYWCEHLDNRSYDASAETKEIEEAIYRISRFQRDSTPEI